MHDVQHARKPGPSEFRKLMSLFTTGVCVVAVETEDGGVAAMTVNSFLSVSLEPLLVCWSLHNSSSQFDLFAKAERFTISILAEDQANRAQRYAARGDTLMQDSDFAASAQGLPVIDGALGHFECKGWDAYEAGDHTMIFGEVTGLRQRVVNAPRALGFFAGEFCKVPGQTE